MRCSAADAAATRRLHLQGFGSADCMSHIAFRLASTASEDHFPLNPVDMSALVSLRFLPRQFDPQLAGAYTHSAKATVPGFS